MKKITSVNLLLFTLIAIGLIFRISYLFIPLYDDSALIGISAKYYDSLGNNLIVIPHPPLTTLFFLMSTYFLCISTFSLRLVPLIFNITIFFLALAIVNKIYNDKKINRIFTVLFSITFIPAFMSFLVDSDGSVMVFFILSILYLLLNLTNTPKNSKSTKINEFLVYLLFAAGVMTKFRFLIFILPLSFWFYFYCKDFRKTIVMLIKTILTSLFVFSAWALTNYYIQGRAFIYSAQEILFHSSPSFISLSKFNPIIYINLFVVLTPLFVGTLILYIINLFSAIKIKTGNQLNFLKLLKEFISSNEKWMLPWLFLLIVLFVLLPHQSAADYARYYSIIFIPILVVASKTIKEVNISLTSVLSVSAISITIGYISALLNLSSDTFWYYLSASGPIIALNQKIMLFYLILSALFFVSFLVKQKKIFFLLFLLFSVSFNSFLLFSTVLDNTHRQLINVVENYAKDNYIKLPTYSWNEDIPFYVSKYSGKALLNINVIDEREKNYAKELGSDENGYYDLDSDISEIEKAIKKYGGTVILLNYPQKYVIDMNPVNKEKINMIKQNCNLTKEVNYEHGEIQIFSC